MEESGVIRGHQANVCYDTSGIQHHYVFICTTRVNRREELADEVRKLPGVLEVLTLTTSTYNVPVEVAAEDKTRITELACAIDDLGVMIEREHLIWEHSRQPFSEFRPPGSG